MHPSLCEESYSATMRFVEKSVFQKHQINTIVKEYNTLNYTPKLLELLLTLYPNENFEDFCKFELHQIINNTIINTYQGEQVLKYALFKHFENKKIIAAFEMRVNTSRVDFVTIDDRITSFEIKSSVDNLTKLAKQSADYLLAFEYNVVVIHEKHLNNAIDIIPASFGIWTINNGKKSIIRKPLLNNQICPNTQLNLLSKKELKTFFYPFVDREEVLQELTNLKINTLFKKALKARYLKRWNFLVNNSRSILPLDIQFFFNTNIHPEHIYS